jgi:predicted P-loop ATPase
MATQDVIKNNLTQKIHRVETTMTSVVAAIISEQAINGKVGYDEFKAQFTFAKTGATKWSNFCDEDYTEIWIALEKNGHKNLSKELITRATKFIAKQNKYDSAIDWLKDSVPAWDGIKRIENFFTDYFNSEDSIYSKAVSNYVWSSLAGRVLVPGIKADMVAILIGEQGCGKSTGVAAICPDPNLFTEITLQTRDDDQARRMRGHLIAEISELRGINSRDEQSIKAFISRTEENWIPKYQEFDISYLRRITFIGTTNEVTFLSDRTGNRRWLPLEVGKVNLQKIKEDCLQLWAEARDTFATLGIQWEAAEKLAEEKHVNHFIADPWEEIVKDGIENNSINPLRITTNEALINIVGVDKNRITKSEQMRMTNVFKAIGLIKNRDSKSTYWHFPQNEEEESYPF